MFPLALGAGAFALAVLANKQGNETPNTTDSWEDIDAGMSGGRLRGENTAWGNNWTSEQSRIIRPEFGRKHPSDSNREWVNYHRKKNQALQDLHVKHQIMDNQRILRSDITCHTRIPCLPDSTFSEWKSVPNAYFEYQSAPNGAFRGDIDYSKYDDKVGNAGGMPIHGNEYIWSPADYFGNPWGPEGQLYNGIRDKLTSRSAFGELPDRFKQDKRVRFGGLPTV